MINWFKRGLEDGKRGKGKDPNVPRVKKDHRRYHQGYKAGRHQTERKDND